MEHDQEDLGSMREVNKSEVHVLEPQPPAPSVVSCCCSPGEFDWDEKTQGIIQGSIYYGFAFSSLPGGRISEVYGGKRMFGVMVACACLLCLVCPTAAYSSTWLFIAVRIIQGLFMGGMFPAMNIVLVKWFPPEERSKFMSIIMGGTFLGSVICMTLSGWLCELEWLGGWPAPFYVVGAAGLVWTAFWVFLVHATPQEHPRITQKELRYILGDDKTVKKESKRVPWGLIFRTPGMWILTLTAVGDSFTVYILLTMLPTYLTNIQHFNLQNAGIFTALPHLLSCLVCLCWGYVVGRLTDTQALTTRRIRQLSASLAFYIPAACMLGMSLVGCDENAAVAILILCVSTKSFTFTGYFSSFHDMSPTYCGTAVGFVGTVSSLSAMAGPLVTGLMINERQTIGAWSNVFYITASVSIVCCTIYIIFIPERQHHWDNPSSITSSSSSSSSSCCSPK